MKSQKAATRIMEKWSKWTPINPSLQPFFESLHQQGFQAFFAGGWVRDTLLGRPCHDIDIATDAPTEKLLALFPHAKAIGKSYGVIAIFFSKTWITVTTFRVDHTYKDHRRPSVVRFGSAQQDALRRDFTINALFFDPFEKKILDYTEQGLSDLNAQCIRCVGNANDRFTEDALRMLRAIRFVAQLGFHIEEKTWSALHKNAHLIQHVSIERVQMELIRILSSPYAPQGIDLFITSGLLQPFIPFPEESLKKNATCFKKAFESTQDLPWLHGFLFLFGTHALLMAHTFKLSRSQKALIQFILQHQSLLDHPFTKDPHPKDFSQSQLLLHPHFSILLGLKEKRFLEKPSTQASLKSWKKDPPFWITASTVLTMGFSQGQLIGCILQTVHHHILSGHLTTRKATLDFIEQKWGHMRS